MSDKPSALERFMDKVEMQPNGCWLWRGAIGRSGGYGMFWLNGRMGTAYRAARELFRGPVPPGLDLDHLCRVRACVHPDHIEPVTHRENLMRGEGACARHARQTTCIRGHELQQRGNGQRMCRTCANEASRRHLERKAARDLNVGDIQSAPAGGAVTKEAVAVPPARAVASHPVPDTLR